MLRWLGWGVWSAAAAAAVLYAALAWPAPDLPVMTPAVAIVPVTVVELLPVVETVQVVVTATPTATPGLTTAVARPVYVWPTAANDPSCAYAVRAGCIWQTPQPAPTGRALGNGL